jgi:hypothetical protein
MMRWVDRPRRNVELEDGPSVVWLMWRLLMCVWILVAAYGVTVLLFAESPGGG